MKTAILTTILGLTALFASAAPADDIRKRDVVRRAAAPSSFFPTAASASGLASSTVLEGSSALASSTALPFSSFASLSSTFIGTGFSNSFFPATGTGAPFATGTAGFVERFAAGGLAGSACSKNGELVCNGTGEFGICNWGRVHFAPVAKGTTCQNGRIVFDKH